MRWATLVLLALLAGCATHYTPDTIADPDGFWLGLWHGLVAPYAAVTCVVAWLLSFVGLDFLNWIEVIGRPNTGFGYYCGFGVGGLLAMLGGGASR